MNNDRKKLFKVYWRELIIRLKTFQMFFLLFFMLVFLGAVILTWRLNIPFVYSLYETFAMFFFATDLDYPFNDTFLQIMWFGFPFLGLIMLADGLSSLGETLKLGDQLSLEWNIEMTKLFEDHIIIVGIGNVGFKLLKRLKDQDVVAVDKKDMKGKDDELMEFILEHKLPFIPGDATRKRALEQAGIRKAKVIFLVIDDDLLNLKIALKARKLNPKVKIIARMFDLDFGNEVAKKLGIDKVISTSTISIPHFLGELKE